MATIGQYARQQVAKFRKNQESHRAIYEESIRPACKAFALNHLREIIELVEFAAKNGNTYVMYNALIAPVELSLKVIVEEMATLLEDCDVELDKSNRLRVSWKD